MSVKERRQQSTIGDRLSNAIGNEWWATLRIRTVYLNISMCVLVSWCVCVCGRALSNIVFAGLDGSFRFRGASVKWKEKHSKTLSVYGHVMVFIFMDMLCCACFNVCVSVCVCVTLLPIYGTILWMPHTHTHTYTCPHTQRTLQRRR